VRAACAVRGTKFLAAPVSGNPKVVAAGQLTLAVSGERDAFDRAVPILRQLGQGVTYVGPDEVARLVKICHNMFLGAMAQSLAEIVVLAERGGIQRSALLEFINNSIVGSPFTRYKSPAFVNLDFSPTFTTTLLLKDFRLGMDAAKATGVSMPVAALCTEMVASAIGAGHGGDDFAVLLAEQARSAGLTMAVEQVSTDDGLSAT
jgi:3-hydroxyisobutyrate dehydrogenase-like beta-hydroxyacid dehydrogenase